MRVSQVGLNLLSPFREKEFKIKRNTKMTKLFTGRNFSKRIYQKKTILNFISQIKYELYNFSGLDKKREKR